jgi:uncharacterized protein involved in outer membrane biogenesis
MAKWTKRILLTIGILVVLLLAAAVLIPILFKDRIEAAVKREVNNNINAVVDWGDWDITLFRSFPHLTVDIEEVKLTNLEPFAGVRLAHIGKITATVDIKSLFGDKIDIRRIGLVRPHIHVKVLEDGRANWGIAKSDSTATEETVADTAASAFNIGLREYWIKDGRVIYDDASLGFVMQLFGVDHEGSGDFTQDLFTLKTGTDVDTANVMFDGVRYLRNARVDIDADLEMDLANMKFTFKENEAAINKLVLGFDGWVAMPGDDIDMDITWNAKKSDLATLLSLVPAEFATDLDGVKMSGKAGFSGYVKGTYNETSMPGFALNVDVDNGRFQYPDLPAAAENIFVDLKVNSPGGSDMDRMVVDLKRFALTMAGNPVEARMHLVKPISDPTVDAALKADLDLASVKKVVPMGSDELRGRLNADVVMKGAMSDIEAQRFEKFTATGHLALQGMTYASDSLPYTMGIDDLLFSFSPRFLALDRFAGSIGSSQVQAKGRMDNYLQWWLKDSTLTGSFDLNADKFDLNELMPASSVSADESTSADTSSLSVIEVPGNIDFTMRTAVGEVIFDDLKLTNVRGGLRVHDHRVDLRDVFFNMFGGAISMSGAYDTKNPKAPHIDFAYDIREMDIEQTVTYVDMVKKMVPIAKTCKGTFSTDLTMQAVLNERMEPDYESLTGKGRLRTRNVRVDGFQPLVELAKALKVPGIENTTLQDVDFTYRFENGKMVTDPFDVRIDQLKANVHGSTAFADQSIDYDMRAKIPTKAFGAAAAQTAGSLLGEANRFLGTGMAVPEELDATIKMTGTIEKPVIKPVFAGGTTSVKEVIVNEVKEQVNERIDKAKEEAIARAIAERDRLIAEAQAQADKIKADARAEAARVKAEAYKAADDELAKVTNPLAKAAAKMVADKAKQEADRKEQQFITEADKRADAVVDAARRKGDELVRKAEETDTTVK